MIQRSFWVWLTLLISTGVLHGLHLFSADEYWLVMGVGWYPPPPWQKMDHYG